jgi:RNA polymerase sigma-70 factor (ECF subfamily)
LAITPDPPAALRDDPDVLEAARSGDRSALEILLTAHYDRVHALCRRMLGNEADALDATQDALLSAVRAVTRFDGRSSFGTWLYRIATNTCLDELRRRRRRPLVGLPGEFDDDGNGGSSSGSGDGQPAFGRRGRDPADEAADQVDLDAALRQVAPEHRAALVLRDVCDLTYDDIALVLDIPIGTVRSRIARGRATLADQLAEGRDESGRPQGGHDDEGNRSSGSVVKPGKRTETRPT